MVTLIWLPGHRGFGGYCTADALATFDADLEPTEYVGNIGITLANDKKIISRDLHINAEIV